MEIPVSQLQMSSKPKSVTELLKEIAMLELEVLQLEKYLVILYQKALDRRLVSLSKDSKDTLSEQRISSDHFHKMPSDQAIINNICLEERNNEAKEQEDVLGCSIHRSHSSLSHQSIAYASRLSPLVGKVAEAVNSYHSLPLTMLEPEAFEASNNVAMYNFSEVKETANWLSEEMVRCISAIYCKLAANSAISNNFLSPGVSIPSSNSGSPQAESNLWSPLRINSFQYLHSDAPYQAGGHFEFSGPYCQMVEVLQIHRDSTKFRNIEPMLQKFRSLVNKLEGVKPSKLNHKEKLAFWINVHNALVMHAFLEYGVPQNKLKRVSLLLKAAYSIGSHTISVSMIQDYILGSQLPHPGQWFHRLLHLKKKFRTGDRRRMFAIDHSEPLSYFALCCGSHSDPPVHVFTPHRVFQDLIAARDQYILSNYRVHKEQNKILLPKIVENYAKDSGLHPPEFMKILEQILPADLQRNRTTSSYYNRHKKGWKGIEWIPHDFSFRCQFPKELLQ